MQSQPSSLLFNHLKVSHLALVFFLINFGLGIIMGIVGIDVKNPLFTPIAYILGMVFTCLWVVRKCNHFQVNVRQIVGKFPDQMQWRQILNIVVAVFLFSMGSYIVLLCSLSYIFPNFVEKILSSKDLTLQQSDLLLHNVVNFIALVVVAPIAEEFLFRGIILNRWRTKWGAVKSLIASSILFGVLHINPVGLSMFGLIAGLLYFQTQALWMPIICHSLNNFIVFSIMVSLPSDNTSSSLESFRSTGWVGAVLLAISLSFLIGFIVKNFSIIK